MKVSVKLSEILGYMSKLETLDHNLKLAPEYSSSQTDNVFRQDNVSNDISPREALSQSPEPDSNYFRVPKVIG